MCTFVPNPAFSTRSKALRAVHEALTRSGQMTSFKMWRVYQDVMYAGKERKSRRVTYCTFMHKVRDHNLAFRKELCDIPSCHARRS